jgi:hypothetical protein
MAASEMELLLIAAMTELHALAQWHHPLASPLPDRRHRRLLLVEPPPVVHVGSGSDAWGREPVVELCAARPLRLLLTVAFPEVP